MIIPFTESAYVLFNKQILQLTLPTMKEPEIKVGDFVNDADEGINDAIGVVTGFEDGFIKVISPVGKLEEVGHFIHPEIRGNDFTESFFSQDGLIISSGYSIKTLANYIVYKNCPHHSLYDVSRELFTKNLCPKCWHENCDNDSIGVGLINIWGSVLPVVMCDEHSGLHGFMGESNIFTNQSKEWKDACKLYYANKK